MALTYPMEVKLPISSRDVFDKLNNKVDPAALEVLMQLAEDNKVLKRQLLDYAGLVQGIADKLGMFLELSEEFKRRVTSMEKRTGVFVESEEIPKGGDDV